MYVCVSDFEYFVSHKNKWMEIKKQHGTLTVYGSYVFKCTYVLTYVCMYKSMCLWKLTLTEKAVFVERVETKPQ